MKELYKRRRPTTLKGLVGQDQAVKTLEGLFSRNFPHFILLVGPSGCGKTTIARIIRDRLEVKGSDFREINASNNNGIATIRKIQEESGFAPARGKIRMVFMDEFHQTSKDAQHAFLKLLEDTPSHFYIIGATTEPSKLLPTVLGRATKINVKLLNPQNMMVLLLKMCKKEAFEIAENSEVLEKIVDLAEGSPRRALVMLDLIMGIDGDEERIAALGATEETRGQAYDLFRVLLSDRSKWSNVRKILSTLEEEAETIRKIVRGAACKVATGSGKQIERAILILEAFRDPFYNTGLGDLICACKDVIGST